MTHDDDKDLDRLLAEAAEAPRPLPDATFMARLLADADRLQPPAAVPAERRRNAAAPRAGRIAPASGGTGGGTMGLAGGWFGGLADVFGGRAAIAGMMAATLAGLWLGIAQPSAVSGLTSAFYGDTPLASLDLLAGSDSLLTEVAQ